MLFVQIEISRVATFLVKPDIVAIVWSHRIFLEVTLPFLGSAVATPNIYFSDVTLDCYIETLLNHKLYQKAITGFLGAGVTA